MMLQITNIFEKSNQIMEQQIKLRFQLVEKSNSHNWPEGKLEKYDFAYCAVSGQSRN